MTAQSVATRRFYRTLALAVLAGLLLAREFFATGADTLTFRQAYLAFALLVFVAAWIVLSPAGRDPPGRVRGGRRA